MTTEKKKIVVVYTSMGSVEMMKRELSAAVPGCEVVNIVDDSLIREVMQHGRVTPSVRRRMLHYFVAAGDLSPDLVACACSSVGAVTEEAGEYLDVPVVRIDRAMIEKALTLGNRIGVLSSLACTMEPTQDYLSRLAAKAGKSIEITARVAVGAYEANRAGDKEKHDELISACAKEIASDVDVLILAQGSMSRLEKPLTESLGKPVISSPHLCALQIAEILKQAQ